MRRIACSCAALLAGCSSAGYAHEADEDVYAILETVSRRVTGDAKSFPIGRQQDTLRDRLLAEGGAIELGLIDALDVAAENSRSFAQQKESLYGAALRLTGEQHDFALRFGGGGTAEVTGTGDGKDDTNLSLSDDLRASVNTTAGTRVVLSFVNTFFRSLVSGGDFDGSSLLSLTLAQPLMRGLGERVVREPLTQAERDVVYAVRDFERFRATFAVDVISEYLGIAQQIQNLESERANLTSVSKSRDQIEALFDKGRRSINDLDRARQNELSAENRLVNAINRLENSLDRFKLTLGLPLDSKLALDTTELDRIEQLGVTEVDIEEGEAIQLATDRRYEMRTALDRVDDSARRIVVAEDALRSQFDFSAVISVPTEPNKPLKFDWSRASWAAGFDLDLALDKLFERNAYRSALIDLDARMRTREQTQDQIKLEVRNSIRNIESRIQNYEIQRNAVALAERRVDSTTKLYDADRVEALEVLDAQDALLVARLGQTAAIVDYTISRLELLRDLEALVIEPKGLRLDLALPLPRSTPPTD